MKFDKFNEVKEMQLWNIFPTHVISDVSKPEKFIEDNALQSQNIFAVSWIFGGLGRLKWLKSISIIFSSISMISNTDPEDINQYIYIQIKIPQGYNGFLSRSQGYGENHYAYTRPDEIRINGNIQNGMIYEYEFTEPINIVHLIWKKNAINKCCYSMFKGCEKRF